MALPALARFASHAVDRVLAVAQVEEDPARLATALTTLQKMVCLDVLPSDKLSRVVDVARARLLDTETPGAWRAAVELAVLTGDPHLRLMVSGIASGLVQPAFPEGAVLMKWARGVAQRALRRYYESHGVLTRGEPADRLSGGCDDLPAEDGAR